MTTPSPQAIRTATTLDGLTADALLYATLERVRTGEALRVAGVDHPDGTRGVVVGLDSYPATWAAMRDPRWSACVDRGWLTAEGERTLKRRPLTRAEANALGGLIARRGAVRVTSRTREAYEALRAWGVARLTDGGRLADLTPWGLDVIGCRPGLDTRMVACSPEEAERWWHPAWTVIAPADNTLGSYRLIRRHAFRLTRYPDGSLRAADADDTSYLRPARGDGSDSEAWALIDHGCTVADLLALGFRHD